MVSKRTMQLCPSRGSQLHCIQYKKQYKKPDLLLLFDDPRRQRLLRPVIGQGEEIQSGIQSGKIDPFRDGLSGKYVPALAVHDIQAIGILSDIFKAKDISNRVRLNRYRLV